jgi:hypothetical protein
MADAATIAGIGTAAGTLFLGAATFASTRSANRAARVAERSLLLGLRPLLIPARAEDPDPKVVFGDGRKFLVASGTALVEEIDGVVYMVIPLRNAGAGMAVLQRFYILTENPLHDPHVALEDGLVARRERRYGPLENFRRQQRDIYIAPGDTGFWQAALRDGQDEVHTEVMQALAAGPEPISVDLLYGDHEGGQHAVSRFLLLPTEDGKWVSSVAFHWTIESPDPRDLFGDD